MLELSSRPVFCGFLWGTLQPLINSCLQSFTVKVGVQRGSVFHWIILVTRLYLTADCAEVHILFMFLLQWTCTEAHLFVCYNPLHGNVVKMPSLLVSERPKLLLHRLFSICLMAIPVATFAAKISFCAAPTVSGIMHLVPAEVRYSKACWRAWFCRWEVVVRPCQVYVLFIYIVSMCWKVSQPLRLRCRSEGCVCSCTFLTDMNIFLIVWYIVCKLLQNCI